MITDSAILNKWESFSRMVDKWRGPLEDYIISQSVGHVVRTFTIHDLLCRFLWVPFFLISTNISGGRKVSYTLNIVNENQINIYIRICSAIGQSSWIVFKMQSSSLHKRWRSGNIWLQNSMAHKCSNFTQSIWILGLYIHVW